MFKRLFDLTVATAFLAVFALPMLFIAMAVRLTSRGPAWYWSDRVGRDNRIFRMPKFRSMRTETPEVATHLLTDSQSFITPLGNFLRKSSLDELPQLWSIFAGHMSFVGPRPALHNQDDLIALRTEKGVHKLTPGLTGWAQINGRDELSIPDKVALDEVYLDQRNFWWDVKILFATFFKVFRSEGVSQTGDRPIAGRVNSEKTTGPRIGVDGSNLRSGGSITHLSEILKYELPPTFDTIVVWGGRTLVDRLPESGARLQVIHDPQLDGSLWQRMRWKRKRLPQLLRDADCNLLYVPAGACTQNFLPVVTMSRNLLPFEPREYRRFGWVSWMFHKMRLLQRSQVRSFRRADGVLFLTEYARSTVTKLTGPLTGRNQIVPHGVDDRFRLPPRPQRPASEYSAREPFRFLYVSKIDAPKHQWQVAKAVGRLRAEGLPVTLDLVGPVDWPPGMKRLQSVLNEVDPSGEFIRHRAGVPHHELPAVYHSADAFVFASSCENMPNILLEAMAAGLPIASADRGPMPEMLGDGGVYFDPEHVGSIAAALRLVFTDNELRAKTSAHSYQQANHYSWEKCARETFAFLSQVANRDLDHTAKRAA